MYCTDNQQCPSKDRLLKKIVPARWRRGRSLDWTRPLHFYRSKCCCYYLFLLSIFVQTGTCKRCLDCQKRKENCIPITLLLHCIRVIGQEGRKNTKQSKTQSHISMVFLYTCIKHNYGIVQRLPIRKVQANCEAVVTVTPAEEEFAVTGVAISTPTPGVIVSYHLKGDLARPITYLQKTKVILVYH